MAGRARVADDGRVEPAGRSRRIETWQIFALAALGSVLMAWSMNEFVLTREVYYSLLGERIELSRIDQLLDNTGRFSVLTYAFTPIATLVRVAFVALLVQMILLLAGVELRFKPLFRVACVAFFAILWAQAVQLIWLLRLGPTEISQAALATTPGALSNLLDSGNYQSPLFTLANEFNLYQVMWCALMVHGLASLRRVSGRMAAFAVGVLWVSLTLFKWGTSLYLRGVST